MAESLAKFRGLCRQLLAEGIKPTATEFAKRGWPYVTVANDRYYGATHTPCPKPGSGTTFTHGRYAVARREELQKAGYVFTPHPKARFEGAGVWHKP